MLSPLAIINAAFAVVLIGIIFAILNVNSKYDWAFGDDPKREQLSYIFMRLLVAAIILGGIAAGVNIFFLQ